MHPYKSLILSISTILFLSGCSPVHTPYTPEGTSNPSAQATSTSDQTESNNINQSDQNIATPPIREAPPVIRIQPEYFLQNRQCQRLREEDACKVQKRTHELTITYKDLSNHIITISTIPTSLLNSDPFNESVGIYWTEQNRENRPLRARVGESYNPEWEITQLYTAMIPMPPNNGFGFVYNTPKSDDVSKDPHDKPNYYQSVDEKSAKPTVRYDTFGKPIERMTYYNPIPEEVLEKFKKYHTDPLGNHWAYMSTETFTYDNQDRLIKSTWTDPSAPSSIYKATTYQYNTESSECFHSITESSYVKTKEKEEEISRIVTQYFDDQNPDYLTIQSSPSRSDYFKPTYTYYSLSNDNCPNELVWLIPTAITQYDKTSKSWVSKNENIVPGNVNTKIFKNVFPYAPDEQYDYDDIAQNYTNPHHSIKYVLNPKYTFEPRDYVQLTDKDVAHPSRKFEMSPRPVSQKEFLSLMTPSKAPHFHDCDECPIENITWYEAIAYANKLSETEGLETCYLLEECTANGASCKNVIFKGLDCKGYRLPTDEEWRSVALKTQKAIKDAGDSAYESVYNKKIATINSYKNKYPERYNQEIDDLEIDSVAAKWKAIESYYDKIAWTNTTYRDKEPSMENAPVTDKSDTNTVCLMDDYDNCITIHPIGQKKKDINGFYDFYGNVNEWIWDWYGYTSRSGDSLGPDKGFCKIIRGGSVSQVYELMNHRSCMFPDMQNPFIGFRLVRTKHLP